MANTFVHLELNTSDLGKAKSFYSSLFDWTLESTQMPGDAGEYTLIKANSGPNGGMMKHPMPGAPSMWLPYVSVDDINAATEKARSLGANIIIGPHEIPNVGWFTIFQDPTGAALALFKGK